MANKSGGEIEIEMLMGVAVAVVEGADVSVVTVMECALICYYAHI